MSPDKLIHMANQIRNFFAHQGEDKAVASIVDHITKFWDPRMRSAIIAHVAAGGESKLDPLVVKAVRQLKVPAPPSRGPQSAAH